MKKMKKLTSFMLCLIVLASAVPVCASAAGEETEPETMTATIALKETTATATGENVKIEGTTVTISASGSYVFSGTLTDGQICVDVPKASTEDGEEASADKGTVKLFFNGVTITGVSKPAVFISNAKNTSINLAADTENYLYDGEDAYRSESGLSFTNNAVIYAKDDLTIKGEGLLSIEASMNHGIHCNNDMKITGGKLKIKTSGKKVSDDEKFADGIRGKDSVQIKGGEIDINANGDGIKSTKGYISISDGDIEVKADNDAVQAEKNITKDGETIKALEISGGRLKVNGGRSLTVSTEGTPISITGGNVLATATEAQPASVEATQPVLELNFTEEQVKDQTLAISKDTETIFSRKPDKKFKFALISLPDLTTDTEYELTLDGKLLLSNDVAVMTVKAAAGVTLIENVTVSASEEFNGDIDCDGHTRIADAILMCRYLAEDKDAVVTAEGIARMDFDKDGLVTASDTQVLLCYLAGVI